MTDFFSFYAFEEYLDISKKSYFEALQSKDERSTYAKARQWMQEALGDSFLIAAAETPKFRESLLEWIEQFWSEFEQLSKKVHEEMIKEEMEKEHG